MHNIIGFLQYTNLNIWSFNLIVLLSFPVEFKLLPFHNFLELYKGQCEIY